MTANYYIKEINHIPNIPQKEENRLIKEAQNGNIEARNTIIKSNLKLIIKIAYEYINRTNNIDDLIQEGVLGLIRAIEKFDENKNPNLRTYANWWIKAKIHIVIYEQKQIIHRSLHTYQKIIDMQRILDSYHRNFNCTPSIKTLQGITKWTSQEIISILNIIYYKQNSLTDKEIDDRKLQLIDTIPNPYIAKPENIVLIKDFYQNFLFQVFILLKRFKIRDRNIFIMRFGLSGDWEVKSLKEVSIHYNLSRERIRQICKKILIKLYQVIQNKETDHRTIEIWFYDKIEQIKNTEEIIS